MALVVGTNSWASRAEASAYLADRIGSEDWDGLADTPATPGTVSKDSLLISAFYWLTGAPQLDISAGSTDDAVKNAQIEAALFLYEHYDELDERRAAMSTGVTQFSYSKRSETLDIHKLTIPDHILGLLRNYAQMNVTADLLGEFDV